ncbi:MAG: DUF1513 domain-containing protein, partial [Candidatus Thiodiazotropha sp. (ex Ctena orbiculata)]|nr:DUF1513 domain-containing protein [Candidatus Thiodiazotropha taylori]
ALTILPAPLLAAKRQPKASNSNIWLSAQGDAPERYSLSWFDSSRHAKIDIPAGFRGHGVSLRPHGRVALMFARRPGTLAIEVDLQNKAYRQAFECKQKRHLFGHGCFSADGKLLFTTEADLDTGQGLIVIRDADDDYRMLDEIPSYGIGPHELKLLNDGRTLVVANGGILTHPDSGRKKLNLDSMASNLCYIDTVSGKQLSRHRVEEAKSSIRHLDVADDDTVAFAMQFQRSAAAHQRPVALAASHRLGTPIRLFEAPEPLLMRMNDYMGSVVINNLSRVAGFTSPKGSVAVFWHLEQGSLLGYHRLHDVCGIAVTADQQHFALSSSNGQMRLLDSHTLKENRAQRQHPDARWDNHLLLTTG